LTQLLSVYQSGDNGYIDQLKDMTRAHLTKSNKIQVLEKKVETVAADYRKSLNRTTRRLQTEMIDFIKAQQKVLFAANLVLWSSNSTPPAVKFRLVDVHLKEMAEQLKEKLNMLENKRSVEMMQASNELRKKSASISSLRMTSSEKTVEPAKGAEEIVVDEPGFSVVQGQITVTRTTTMPWKPPPKQFGSAANSNVIENNFMIDANEATTKKDEGTSFLSGQKVGNRHTRNASFSQVEKHVSFVNAAGDTTTMLNQTKQTLGNITKQSITRDETMTSLRHPLRKGGLKVKPLQF
jgi:hypothetical protein